MNRKYRPRLVPDWLREAMPIMFLQVIVMIVTLYAIYEGTAWIAR